MIKAVIVDFGQTLVDSADGFRKAEKDVQSKIFDNLGLDSWPAFLSLYRELRGEFHARSDFSRSALWQDVYSHYNQNPTPGFLLDAERDYWNTVKARTNPFPEAKGVLGGLVSQYRLALITNTQGQTSSQKHRLALFPELESFFEVVIVAGEAGVPPKPNPRPFQLCLQKLGIASNEAIYVGDDWRIDICGAKEAGMQPVWLQHRAVSRKWPSVQTSVPVITSLEQLPKLVPIIDDIDGSAGHKGAHH